MKLEDIIPLIEGDYEVYHGENYIDEYRAKESITFDSQYKHLRDKKVVSVSCKENRNSTKNIVSVVVE